MKNILITITGTKHYFGSEFLEKGSKVTLVKEPDNEFDKEAIVVKVKGLGKIGYVANSSFTVIGDSYSAGRIYDLIKKKAKAKVIIKTPKGIIAKIDKKYLK